MNRLLHLLQEYRGSIFQALDKMQLKPQFFAFRWLTLLLSQEFKLPGQNNQMMGDSKGA